MSVNDKNGGLFSLMMSSWGSGGPETRKRLVTAFSQNDHFTLKVGLPRNSQYVDFACNPEGDTLLHLATRRVNEKSVKMLLRIGGDPNARNKLGRTPLHEAAIAGSLKILQLLIDYGGDLRLHDAYHQTPRQLTTALTQDKKMDMAYFIEVMRFLSTCYNSYETEVMVTHRKLKDLKKAQNSRAPSAPLPEINCLGFGVFCTEKDKTSLISCVPFVRERELIMVFNRYSFANGPFTVMSTMTLEKSAVTVRKLRQDHNPTVVDILITECSYQRRLRHPGLLFLIAVFNTTRLDSIGLVFEHINLGSLYMVLHMENRIFPPKKISYILCQICDALMYIHRQNLVHNSISSFAIQLLNEKTAKLTNFEYMNYVHDSPSNWLILREERSLKDSTWRWSSPELLEERIPSFKSDLFSFCCVIWEIYHRSVPWHDLTQKQVRENYRSGQTLEVTSSNMMKVLKAQITSGLIPSEQQRNIDLEELRMTLVKESVKTFVERGTDSPTDLFSDKPEDPLKDNPHFTANLVFDADETSNEMAPEFEPPVVSVRRPSAYVLPKIVLGEENKNKSADTNDTAENGVDDNDRQNKEESPNNHSCQSLSNDVVDRTTSGDIAKKQPVTERERKNKDNAVSGVTRPANPVLPKKNSSKVGSVRQLIKVFEGL